MTSLSNGHVIWLLLTLSLCANFFPIVVIFKVQLQQIVVIELFLGYWIYSFFNNYIHILLLPRLQLCIITTPWILPSHSSPTPPLTSLPLNACAYPIWSDWKKMRPLINEPAFPTMVPTQMHPLIPINAPAQIRPLIPSRGTRPSRHITALLFPIQ